MRYIGLKFVACLVLTTATLLGFLAAGDSDEHPGWRGSSLLEITDNRGTVSWEQVVATLTAVADQHHVGIIRVDENFYDGDHRRNVYVTSGDPGADDARWARDLLRPFGRSPALELTVKPFVPGDGLDPRAAYRVFGPPDAALDLAARFDELGLHGTPPSSVTFGMVFLRYLLSLAGLAVALVTGLVTLTVGSVLLSARRYAVWRLHGASVLQMMWRDARALAPFCATTTLVFGAAVCAFLFWYNGWNQFSVFARFAGNTAVATGIVVVLSYVIAVLAVSVTSTVEALKGRMRLGPAMALLYPLRVAAVLLVVPAVAGVAADYTGLMNRNAALPHVAGVGESVNITLPGYRTREESDRNYQEVGAWLRQLDSRGRVTVVKRDSLQAYLPATESLGETEVLWVNDTFLASQPVLDSAGSRIGSAPENTVRIIVPERLNQHADSITGSVLDSFAPAALPAGVAVPHVQRLAAADGQELFLYAVKSQSSNADGTPMNRPMARDAVIVSIPNGSPLISDSRLAAWASYYGAVLSPEDVTSSVGRDLPSGSILGMLPIAGLLTDNKTAEIRRLISDSLMLVLVISVLASAAVSSCLLYTRKHSRAIYAGHVAGRGFWRIHRRQFLIESIIPLAVAAWICVSNWQRAGEVATYARRGIPAPPSVPAPDWWRLVPAMTASMAAILLFTALLVVVHRRITAAVPDEA
ncbi:hypothetical protein AB0M48_16815 [Lentzea sp. NPDC051208]|uniref:hypothetical protein n=1 Tax=Lentzea sp. NPDC051208 TaxID=3154642 RepID=UPI003425AD53